LIQEKKANVNRIGSRDCGNFQNSSDLNGEVLLARMLPGSFQLRYREEVMPCRYRREILHIKEVAMPDAIALNEP